jgi:predicted metalloendopeptidase
MGVEHEIDRLDRPVGKTEWGMCAAVNAYQPLNNDRFSSAILRPPFFG